MTYKIEMRAKDMRATLAKLKLIIESRSTVPILTNVLFDGAKATVTNLDQTLTIDLSAPDTTTSGGVITVGYADLTSYMAGVESSALVTLAESSDGQSATISDGEITRRLYTLPPADMPLPTTTTTTTAWHIPAGDLHGALTACKLAMSTEETRYYLCGVHLANEAGQLVIVSTDGHKLVKVTPRHADYWPGDWTTEPGAIIIPSKAILATIGLCAKDKDADSVYIQIQGESAVITGESWVLQSKLVAGTFPPYRRVMPKIPDQWVVYNAGTTAKKIKRLAGQGETKSSAVTCDWQASQWYVGRHTATMDMPPVINSASDSWRGGKTVGIDGAYYSNMAAMLAAFGPDMVQYIMPNPGDPVLFEPAKSPDLGDVLTLVMPMRI